MTDDQHMQAYHDLTPELRQVVDNATGPLQRRYSPHLAEHVISGAAYRAYQAGRHDALADLMSTRMTADSLGITPHRVRRLAIDMGLGWKLGTELLFRAEDVEALRNRPDGRRKAT